MLIYVNEQVTLISGFDDLKKKPIWEIVEGWVCASARILRNLRIGK